MCSLSRLGLQAGLLVLCACTIPIGGADGNRGSGFGTSVTAADQGPPRYNNPVEVSPADLGINFGIIIATLGYWLATH
jgi:hypothetical protein